jgi:membrane-bound lytic murein transglycosylase B
LGDFEGRFSCLGFSPAEYSRYGVDENLDGIVDLNKNYMDILASASNYLIKMGWQDYNSWGFVVSLPMNVDDVSENLQLINFKKIGFKQYNGDSLPDSKDVYTLINTNFNGRLALLVNSNFYNLVGDGKSLSYTVSLAFLSKELNDFIKYYKALNYSKKIDEKDKRINTVEPVKEELYRNYYKKRKINDAK